MMYAKTMIDIFFNPASYCDTQWLRALDNSQSEFSINALPPYVKNALLLNRFDHSITDPLLFQANDSISLFIENWRKVNYCAYLIGLRILKKQIVKQPYIMSRLSKKKVSFMWLPMRPDFPSAKYSEEINTDLIVETGASFIFSVATYILPLPLLERLKLCFSPSVRYQQMEISSIDSSLASLKWVFSYA